MKPIHSSESSKPYFKNLESNVKNYIRQLETENAQLQKKIAKLEVANLSITNKINAVEKEVKRLTINPIICPTIVLPYNGHEPLPTHVETADGKRIRIYYKTKKC
jgi:hypothetical protein